MSCLALQHTLGRSESPDWIPRTPPQAPPKVQTVVVKSTVLICYYYFFVMFFPKKNCGSLFSCEEPRKTTGSWTTIFQDPKEAGLKFVKRVHALGEFNGLLGEA